MTTPKDKSQEGPYRVERFNAVHSSVKLYEVVGSGIFNGRSEPMDYHAACVWCDRLNAAYAAGQAAKYSSVEQMVEEIMKAVNAWADDQPHVGWYVPTKQADLRSRLTSLISKP